MVPVKLILEGIYSYRERQTIDFTRLTEAKLFGIFGPVGSGKSTILEAMIYAIYGVIDRLNSEVKYNLMNLQSDYLFLDFEFKAGEGNRLYRATVESKRNKRKFMEVSSPKFSYYVWENEEWMPCEREDVVVAIGLNVQNFKRVVIIPQGKFQDFLMLRDKERTDMMMELFGELRRYDLGGKVAYLEGETTRKVIDLRGQLTGLGEVNEELLEEEKKRFSGLQEEGEGLKKDIQVLQEKEEYLRKIKQFLDERGVRMEDERKLLEQKEDVLALQREMEEYEFCFQHFQHPLNSWDDVIRRLTESERLLGDYRDQWMTKQKDLNLFMETFRVLKEAYENRGVLKEKADQLEGLLRLRVLQREQQDLESRRVKGESMVVAIRRESDELKLQLNERKEALVGLIGSIPDMKMLSDVREWYNMQYHLKEEDKQVNEELKRVEEETRRMMVEMESLQKENSWFEGITVVSYDGLLDACHQREGCLAEGLKTEREEMMHLNIRQRLVDFAKELSEGAPCPLCGALSHPAPLHAVEVVGELKERTERLSGWEREEKEIHKLMSYLMMEGERYRLNREKCRQLQEKLKGQKERLQGHLVRFVWEGFEPDREQHLTDEMDRVALLNESRQGQEAVIRVMEEGLEQKRSSLEKYIARLDEIKREVVQRETQVELVQEVLQGGDKEVYAAVSDDGVKREIGECRERFDKLGVDFQSDSEKLRVIEAEYRKLEGSVEEKNKEVLLLKQEKTEGSLRLNVLLEGGVYTDLLVVRKVLERKLDMSVCREMINKYNQQLNSVQMRRVELEQLLVGVSYDSEVYEKLVMELHGFRMRERDVLSEWGALGNRIKDMEIRGAARRKIGKELNALESRLQNLQVLKGLFRGNDFVKFVSSIYLQNLCNAANERFYRMTRQCLKLELNEENDFIVRDFMNEGRTRSARTLSGGQIFQASLSLALALTDNIRHLTGSNQNFFFLDEGFGSLDRESLRVVFDTLKSLRAENRVVGLISHVEEMQQELPVCLFVENLMDRGSVVNN